MDNAISRKEFLQRLSLLGLSVFGAAGVLNSCGSSDNGGGQTQKPVTPPPAAEKDPCGDTTGLTETDLNIRKNFQYVAKSTDPSKVCDNCQFWKAPEAGAFCGGCQIIQGPMNPKGYCNQWLQKTTG